MGAVQGLSEFLPISSSGHLILAHWIFGRDLGLSFDVALHWGTLLAVLVYFRTDLWLIVRGFFHSLLRSTRDLENNIYQRLPWLILVSTIPAVIIGKILESKAETIFRNPLLVALDMAIFASVILFAEKVGKREKNLDRITYKDALLIGLFQSLAIIPGVSRSGATIAAGLFLAFKRPDAARFSFLMSIPVIFGAGLLESSEFLSGGLNGELLLGFVSSAIFGFLAIKYLLRFISKNSFKIFAYYRFVLAAIILAIYLLRS